MPDIFGAQTEGICFKDGYEGFISCEKSNFDQQIFSFSTGEWTADMLSINDLTQTLKVNIHPNPYEEGDLIISVDNPVGDEYRISIFESSGKSVYNKTYNTVAGDTNHSIVIQVPEILPGIYFIDIISGEWYAREKLIVR
jgi:hypothetical protein